MEELHVLNKAPGGSNLSYALPASLHWSWLLGLKLEQSFYFSVIKVAYPFIKKSVYPIFFSL
jgi:hypothetical protein